MTATRALAVVVAGVIAVSGTGAMGRYYVMNPITDLWTTGVYENLSNKVDRVAGAAVGDLSLLNAPTTGFAARVQAAYDGDVGGVCGFDNGQGYDQYDPAGWGFQKEAGLSPGTSGRAGTYFSKDMDQAANWKPGYGSTPELCKIWFGANKGIRVDLNPDQGDMDIWCGNTLASAISGPSVLANGGTGSGGMLAPGTNRGAASNAATLNFVNCTRPITELALTCLSGGVAWDWTVEVTFDNGSTDTRGHHSASGYGADDVFYDFAAPAGRSIVALHWEVPATGSLVRPAIENLAIITGTPEVPAHPGDANKDGMVDLQDFGALKDHFGAIEGASWGNGDFNGDGGIDLQDFGILKDHFGHTNGDSPLTAVPEPATLTLLALAACGLARRRR